SRCMGGAAGRVRTLRDAGRLLVMHLTDAPHQGTAFAGNVLEHWGTLPHLVRGGVADISLKLAGGTAGATVWALDMSGRRSCELPASAPEGGVISFQANTLGGGAPDCSTRSSAGLFWADLPRFSERAVQKPRSPRQRLRSELR
ncbi:MAG TPA: hypothetical protein VIO38_10330, partial [Rariglobus sp.]